VKWYDTLQFQSSNNKVYSSFGSIYINPVIQVMLGWVVWGCEKDFTWVAWLLINIARVGVKVRVGLEILFYKILR
jgi:hypothetical protein